MPRELFAVERLQLKPLPAWIPEVYRLHQRTVDVEGYVSMHAIRYSVPVAWIGRRVEVRETRDHIEMELDPRHIVRHARDWTPYPHRVTLPEHKPARGEAVKRSDSHPEEQAIVRAFPDIVGYVRRGCRTPCAANLAGSVKARSFVQPRGVYCARPPHRA